MKQDKPPVKKTFRDKLKHAFALTPEKPLTEEDLAVLDKTVDFIVRRKMEATVILALQSLSPMNFIGSQILVVLEPFLDPLIKPEDYQKLVKILEDRQGIELFIQRIEKQSQKG